PREEADDGDPGALVAVDAPDDERLARAPGIAALERADRPAARRSAEQDRPPDGREREAHVQVVVVERELLDDPRRPGQPGVRADEDVDGARADQSPDQVPGQGTVDLVR